MVSKANADRAAGAVFLIGLGLLFTPLSSIVGGFWPGILFVLGASSLARGMAEGLPWYNVTGGLWLIGLGLIFLWGFSLPLLLILVGMTMLFGYSFRSADFGAKRKRAPNADLTDTYANADTDANPVYDEKAKHDEFV